jgi:ubiquinone/menaquinone biosynthesis C-methylase UbiE
MEVQFNEKQKVQEDGYERPYHWMHAPESTEARLYFGYLSLCTDFLKGKEKNIQILDAGCGDGRFVNELCKQGFTDITGTDYSERALAFGRLFVPHAKFVQGDFTKLPFTDGQFDFIFLIETLEHIPPEEISPILKEFKRILKNDGSLIITVPSLYGGAPDAKSKHYQHFTVESLTASVVPHFEVEEMYGQDLISKFHLHKLYYKLIDNSLWEIKKLKRYYNLNVWRKHFNKCEPTAGRRLVALCKKTP